MSRAKYYYYYYIGDMVRDAPVPPDMDIRNLGYNSKEGGP